MRFVRGCAVSIFVYFGLVVVATVAGLEGRPWGWIIFLLAVAAFFASSVKRPDQVREEEMRRLVTDASEPPMSPSPPTGISPFNFSPTGPEQIGEQARQAYSNHDFSGAMEMYRRAIDKLHDLYVFERFRQRQPSASDAWIINGFVSSLGAARATNPTVGVADAVKEVTHRLRTISTAADRAGANSALYREALEQIAGYAPEVDVSGVFWE